VENINCEKLDLESYDCFLNAKLSTFYNVKGRRIYFDNNKYDIGNNDLILNENHLFDYQKFIVDIAFSKQRYAIFADCGLGKTAMFLAFIKRFQQITNKKILIICPLMVVNQTIREEIKFYNESNIKDLHNEDLQEWVDSGREQVGITNIDKFHKSYDLSLKVGCVVLDESSILKNGDGITRNCLIESCKGIPFKLCCSATPAPNDREEYANHSTFLEYTRSNNEFFSRFFVNKDNGWVIKPHGLEFFYKNLSEWSVFIKNPQNYGFDNNILELPKPIFNIKLLDWTEEQKKHLKTITLNGDVSDALINKLFYLKLSKGILDKNKRVEYIDTNKVKELLEILKGNKDKKTVIWVSFNEEEKLISKVLKENNYNFLAISGKTLDEERIKIIEDFENKSIDILISKSKLLGFGLNLPFVTVQIFNGLSDSYEQFYQSIKRSYRYGNKENLNIYIPVTKAESKILNNVLKKKETWEYDSEKQEKYFIENLQENINKFFKRPFTQKEDTMKTIKNYERGENWEIYNGDNVKVLDNMKEESIDLAVFSPPFASLFTYSNEIADMGNSGDGEDEFNLHFEFFLKRLHKVMKKGRIVCCHLSQLSTFKGKDGFIGLKDFRGKTIELFQKQDFIFFGEWAVLKNPQMQSIKEKVRSLSFAQLFSDRLNSRAGLSDFILVFKKQGESDTKLFIDKEKENYCNTCKKETLHLFQRTERDAWSFCSICNNRDYDCPSPNEWIEWASGVWTGIRESDTLNARGTKSEEDVKHICPLNLEVIRRCIRMYSTRGELILDPFNGIGSVGVIALERSRKYIGIELKEEYFKQSVQNLKKIEPYVREGLTEEVYIKEALKRDLNNKSLLNYFKE